MSSPFRFLHFQGGSGLVPVHDTLHGAHPLASRVKDTETGKDEEGGGSGNLPSRSSSFVWGRRLPIALPLPLRAPVEGSEEQANKENDAGLMLLGRVKETEGERQTATSPSPQRRNLMRWGALAILSGCGGQGEPRKETGGDTVDIVEMGGVQGEPRLAATFRGPSGSPASYVVTTTGQLGFLQGDSHRGDEENLTNSGKNKGELRVRVVDVNYFPGLSLSQHAPSAASTPANARLRETASLVCCGESHAIVVTVTGRLFSWGSNFFCQQGNGVRSLEGGTGREGDGEDSEGDGGSSEDRQSSSVLSERGEIGGWEGTESVDMYGGSLGSAGEEVLSLPLGDRVAVRAACGKFHTVVALADGSVWHWGAVVGSSGPLVRRPARCPLVQPGGGGERAGDDGDSDMIPAHSVRAGPSVRFLSAGDGFSVAVTARPPSSLHGDRESRLGDSGDSGESSRSLCWDVFCWGVNEKGQLGLSDLKERESPTRLPLLLLSAASGEEKKISPDDEEGRGYLEEFSAIFNKGDRTIVGMDSGPSHSVILVRREIGNHFQEEKNEGGAQNGASPLSVSCGGEEEASPSPSQSPAGPSSDILEVLVWGGGGMPGPAREEAKTLKVPRLESAHSLLRPQVSSHFEAEAAFSVAEEDKKKQAVKEDTEESAEAEEEEEEESADPHIALALASPSNPAAAGAQKMAILIPPGTTAPSVQCWRSDTFILVGAGLDASSTDATSPTSPFPFKVAIEGVEGQGGSEREREKGSRERERFQQAKSRSFWKEAAGSRIHRMQRLQRHFHLKTMPALSPTSLSSPEEGAGNEQAAYVDLALSRQARIQRGDEETHANDSSSISLSVTAPPQTDNDRRTGARGSIVSVVSAPPDSHRQAQTDHSSLGGAQVTRCPHCKASVPLPPTTIGTARSQNSDDGGFSGVPSAAPVSIGVQQVATHRPHASKRLYIRQEGEVEGGLDRSAHAARDKEKRDKEKEGGGIFWKILSMLKGDEEQDGDGGESSQVKARRSSLLADTPGEKDQAEGPQWAAGEGDADRQNRRASVLLTKQFVLQEREFASMAPSSCNSSPMSERRTNLVTLFGDNSDGEGEGDGEGDKGASTSVRTRSSKTLGLPSGAASPAQGEIGGGEKEIDREDYQPPQQKTPVDRAQQRRQRNRQKQQMQAATAKEAALRQRALRVATRVVEQDPKYLLPDGCRISSKEIEMLKPIGEGAYGKVWAATFRGALVAVKRMRVHRVDDRLLKDFLGELALMRFLRHPHVVLLIGALSKGSDMAIVLEYCARGSLWDVLHDVDISLSWGTRVRFARQICQGMLYLHRWRPRPILHRDLKSLNILVDASMNLKISDFGWARVKAAEGDNMTGSVGTYQWMAPEVLESSEYSEKADVFSFGVVLWEILSRQPPYPGMDPVNVATQVVKNGLRPEIPPDSPRRWVSLMNRCWAQDPKDRLDFAQILEELDVFAAAIEEQKSKRYSSKERKH